MSVLSLICAIGGGMFVISAEGMLFLAGIHFIHACDPLVRDEGSMKLARTAWRHALVAHLFAALAVVCIYGAVKL